MKLAYFSPLPPKRSGIADYSEELLPYLAQSAEITLFVDGFEPSRSEVISRFEILDYRKQPDVLKRLESYDAILYHMGNDHRYHTGIFETMIKYPGILVLHDFALQDFFFNLAQTRKDWRVYLDEVGLCYGETVKQATSEALAAGATPRIATNPVRFPLNERIVRASRGVIVHSNWSRQRLMSIAPATLVKTIPHHITETAAGREPATRVSMNGPVRIASFGLINPHKGIARALRALAALRDRHQFRYTLVGDPNQYFDVRSLIRDHGLEDRVEITGHVDLNDFQRHISETDIAINLRESIIGETSGSLCRIMAAAVPAIVVNAGWFGELPGDAVVKVDLDDDKSDEVLRAYLEALVIDRELRQKIGANARRHVLAHNDIRQSAEHYLAFVARIAGGSANDDLVDDLANEFRAIGLNPSEDDESVREVLAAVSPLMSAPLPEESIIPPAAIRSEPAVAATAGRTHENGRLERLEGIDYRQAAIDYVAKLDPEHRHYLFTKPFYNLANKPPHHAGEGMDAETFRHFCDFANIAVALALPAGSSILDVGCGAGWLSEYFARLGYVVKGIDISPELIRIARERMASMCYDVDHQTALSCDFAEHDIERAPVGEQFDAVICYDSLHHFEDEHAVMKNLAAAISYGGVLFILEGARPVAGSIKEGELIEAMREYGALESPFSREYLKTLLDEHGFAVVGDYISVNGLFERESLAGDRLRVQPPEINYLLCKKVARDEGQAGSSVPDSRKPGVLLARLNLLSNPPQQVAPGERLSIPVSIENVGDTLWLTSSRPGPGIVMPAVRVFDQAGALVTEFHGEPLLPHSVAPGEIVHLKIEYQAPKPDGEYRLKLDLVNQQICWFEQRGSQALEISFEVRSADS